MKYLVDGLQVQCVHGLPSSHHKATTLFNHSFLEVDSVCMSVVGVVNLQVFLFKTNKDYYIYPFTL